MQRWLVNLHLPVYSRLWGALILLSVIIVTITLLLFGVLPVMILCIVSTMVYFAVCFICFQPEGKYLREKLDRYYEKLFIHTLNYAHSTSRSLSEYSTSDILSGSNESLKKDKTTCTQKKPQVQASKPCHREAQKIIQLIMQDFIYSWYENVTDDLEFPDDVQKLLEHIALETNIRMQKIDLEKFITEIVMLLIPYLEVVNKSGMRKYNDIEVFDVNSEKCLRAFECDQIVAHRALNSRELELRYHRQALDALIQCAFPSKYRGCDFACMFVRELLLNNIIEPLFDRFCDPDFLVSSLPLILKKASPEKVQRELMAIKQENEALERKMSHGKLILKIKGSPIAQRRRFQTQSGRFYGSDHYSFTPAPEIPQGSPQQPKKQRPMSMASIPSEKAAWTLSTDFEAPVTQSCRASYSTESPQLGVEPDAYTPNLYMYGLPNGASPPKEGASWSNRSSTLTSNMYEYQGSNVRRDSEGDDSNWDMIEVPRGPIYFDRHVRVVSGSGSSSHIAYIFKFPKKLLSEEELAELEVNDGDTHLEGMKRYSQFDKLHSSLLKTPLSTYLKGISLPRKLSFTKVISKLSLTSRDPDPVELQERIQGLESYLQAISAIPSVADSPIFREFLVTGIEALRQANIVKPQAKASKRKSFLGRRKSQLPFKDSQKAQRIPSRPMETVLSAYLDTNLPLPPHSLHTLHSLKNNDSKPPTKVENIFSLKQKPESSHGNVNLLDDAPLQNRRGKRANTDFLTYDHRATLVSQNQASKSPLQNRRATLVDQENSSPVNYRRDRKAVVADTSSPPKSSLQSNYAIIGTPSSTNSASSFEASYVPISDLTTTLKASDSIHHSFQKYKSRRSSTLVAESRTTDTDTDQSSVASYNQNIGLMMEGEELQTVDSTTSLSSASFVSAEDDTQVKITGVAISPSEQEPPIEAATRLPLWKHLKSGLSRLLQTLVYYFAVVYNMVLKGMNPVTQEVSLSIAQEHMERIPLTNAILALASEASQRHCPKLWACHMNTQLALLVLTGGGMERYMWKELKELMNSSENWCRALYHLRHTLWPQGHFISDSNQHLSEEKKKENLREAAAAIRDFLPNFLPAIVGPTDFDNVVNHILDCLQNPKVTRYIVLRLIDVFLIKLIPELNSKDFQKQLARLRTLVPPPRNRFSARPT